jgi:Transposase DDE domain
MTSTIVAGDQVSLRWTEAHPTALKIRAWIETHFGWLKSSAGLRQVKHRGIEQVEASFQRAMAANNLVRLPKLIAAGATP